MFKIPLMGEYTGSVEALPSYLHRSAFHHGMPTTKFIKYLNHEAVALDLERPETELKKVSQTVSMKSLLTYGSYPERYSKVIFHLTGVNVLPATFLPLKHTISRPQNEINRRTRWCPECFKSIRSLGAEPYIKLIWHLSEITHCPHHLTPLIDSCPNCNAKQDHIGRTLPLDQCHECGSLLSNRTISVTDRIQPSWIHQAEDLLKLIQHIACKREREHFDEYFIQPEGLTHSMRELAMHIGEPDYFHIHETIWKDKDLRRQLWGNTTPSLKALRLLAFLSGVDLFEVITGQLISRSPVLLQQHKIRIPYELRKTRNRNRKDHEKNYLILSKYLTHEHPLSLKKISRVTGLSIGYISYRFPVLKQCLVEKYQEHINKINLQKHYKATKAALNYFYEPNQNIHKKSRKQAFLQLRKETKLTKHYLKPAINRVYESYVK